MNEILELIKTEASNVVRLIVQRKTELNMMRQNPSVEGAVLSAIRDRVSNIETGADRLCSKLEQDHFAGTSKMVPTKPKLKVIRGNENRGNEVIKILEDLGGNNRCNYNGNIDCMYYYVDTHDQISNNTTNSSFFNDYELEVLELPKPKLQVIKGCVERDNEVITLLESLGGNNKSKLQGDVEYCYYYIDEYGIIISRINDSPFFKDYDLEILKLPEQKRWRAEYEFIYYYVDSDFHVVNERDYRSVLDNGRYSCGNYFKTEEEAEEMAKKIKAIMKGDE